jgi:hypothetical protein
MENTIKQKLLSGAAMNAVWACQETASQPPAIRLADGVHVPGRKNAPHMDFTPVGVGAPS